MATKTVWTNVDLDADERAWLQSQIQPYELSVAEVRGTNLEEGAGDDSCRNAEIAFGQPAVSDLLSSDSIQWVHLTSAGYTRYDTPTVRDSFESRSRAMTNSSGVYDDPCAQHAVAFMLAHNRRLLPSAQQHSGEHGWTYARLRPETRVLGEQNVLLVGYGAIARRMVELLKPFGCHLRGIRRNVTGEEAIPTYPIADLSSHLGWADHVVNILPANSSTALLFNQESMALMKTGAGFYNIGRGDTVDQAALLNALNSGHLACAYLDVTSPEPFPATEALWSHPNCLITPHIAGGLQNEKQALLDHFVANFKRFANSKSLEDRVY